MVAQATQTTSYQTNIEDTDTNLSDIRGKKRRSHRNGKRNT